MQDAPQICFTFVGDVTRDSRLRRFLQLGSELTSTAVLALTDADTPPSFAGGEVHSVPLDGRALRSALPAYWRTNPAPWNVSSCRVYVASDLYSLPLAARLAKAAGGTLIYDARELYSSVAALTGRHITQRFWSLLEKRYARRASAILTVNNSIADVYRESYPSVHVIRNLPDAIASLPTDLLRTQLGIAEGQLILLSQGGVQEGRGALLCVEALGRLPLCDLVFLGDGPLTTAVEEAAQRHDVRARVHLLPAVPSEVLPDWTASADIGLCLIENRGRSYYLSLPNKLFEYMAAGLPVIGSDFPEIGAVLKESGAGLTIAPENANQLVEAVRSICDNPALRETLAQKSRQAGEKYQWENEKGLLRDLYLQHLSVGG